MTAREKTIFANKASHSLDKAIRRLETLSSKPGARKKVQVFVTANSVIVKTKPAPHTKSTLSKSVLGGHVVTSRQSQTAEHYKATFEGIARLVKESSLDTEKAISTLKRSPSAADKDFFAAVKQRVLSLK